MIKLLDFTCTRCRSHNVEVIHTNASVTTPIIGINECMELQYGEAKVDDPGEVRFQCSYCGNHICSGNDDDLLDSLGYDNPND